MLTGVKKDARNGSPKPKWTKDDMPCMPPPIDDEPAMAIGAVLVSRAAVTNEALAIPAVVGVGVAIGMLIPSMMGNGCVLWVGRGEASSATKAKTRRWSEGKKLETVSEITSRE